MSNARPHPSAASGILQPKLQLDPERPRATVELLIRGPYVALLELWIRGIDDVTDLTLWGWQTGVIELVRMLIQTLLILMV